MKKAYQKQFHRRTRTAKGQGKIEPADAVQLTLDRTEVLQQMQEGLLRHGGESLGLELAALLMKDKVERSSVSRAFAAASVKKIAELNERRLDDTRFPVVFIDGIGWADTTMVVAQ